MRLSTIPNKYFWPVWALFLVGLVGAFMWGIPNTAAVPRGIIIVGYVVGVCALAFAGARRNRIRTGARVSPAQRKYLMRFLPSMALYGIALTAAILLYKHHKPTGVLAYLIAILPAVPIMGAIWAVGRFFIEEDDEFQRKVMIESYLWATGATLAICTVVGFLQAFDLVPAIQLWTVFPLQAVCVAPASAWVKWKYR